MSNLDNSWQVPEGFEPTKNYRRDSKNGETLVGHAKLLLGQGGGRNCLEFYVKEDRSDTPALPLKAYGELWSRGWDIPTRYAVDKNGRCYMDNAHGHALLPVDPNSLVAACESDSEKRTMQQRLGLVVDLPEWQLVAQAAGWLPKETASKLKEELRAAKTRLPSGEALYTLIGKSSDPVDAEDRETSAKKCYEFSLALEGVHEAIESALKMLP